VSRNLALFDFDGTLTFKDSFLELIKFQKGKKSFFRGLLFLSPVLFLYKLKLIPNWKAKEIVIEYFFKGDSLRDFQAKCDQFANAIIPAMLRPLALQKIKEHKDRGDRVIVVTASAENWLKCWTDTVGVELLGTRLEISNGKLTGKIAGNNCYGPEKLRRVLEQLNPKEYSQIYVYGDSKGDGEILGIATEKFYRRLQ
jgi:phosphatidylglycerophosphatase C